MISTTSKKRRLLAKIPLLVRTVFIAAVPLTLFGTLRVAYLNSAQGVVNSLFYALKEKDVNEIQRLTTPTGLWSLKTGFGPTWLEESQRWAITYSGQVHFVEQYTDSVGQECIRYGTFDAEDDYFHHFFELTKTEKGWQLSAIFGAH